MFWVDEMVNGWCHLAADSPDELQAIANKLGLKREWMHLSVVGALDAKMSVPCPHYDLKGVKMRQKAIDLGAKQLSRKDSLQRLKNAMLGWKLKRVEAVVFPALPPTNGEGRPDGPPYVSIDEVMAGEHVRESDLSKALRVIREMDGLLDTLVELLNASGGDWEESGQADVLRNFRAFVNGCGELLGNMKKVWG